MVHGFACALEMSGQAAVLGASSSTTGARVGLVALLAAEAVRSAVGLAHNLARGRRRPPRGEAS